MNEITLLGVDLAKTIFRINAIDANGRRAMNKNRMVAHSEEHVAMIQHLAGIGKR